MFTLRVAKVQPEYVTYRERYKVDLPLQMAECEANYILLSKLLHAITENEYRFITTTGNQESLHVLRVLERSRYTITLQLNQAYIATPTRASSWLKMPLLTVRLYHDAKLAEVLAWEGHKRLRPRYDYPNQAMYQSDEKHQLNRFLGEWLKRCIENGRSIDNLTPLTQHSVPGDKKTD